MRAAHNASPSEINKDCKEEFLFFKLIEAGMDGEFLKDTLCLTDKALNRKNYTMKSIV